MLFLCSCCFKRNSIVPFGHGDAEVRLWRSFFTPHRLENTVECLYFSLAPGDLTGPVLHQLRPPAAQRLPRRSRGRSLCCPSGLSPRPGAAAGTDGSGRPLRGPRPRPPPALSADVTRGRSARRTLWSPRGALRGALWRGRAGCQRGAPEGSGAGPAPGRVGARGGGAMGVPKFYRWVSERYPCLSQVLKEHQVRRRPRGAGAGRHPRGLSRRQGPGAALRSAGARGPVRGARRRWGPPGGRRGPGRRCRPAAESRGCGRKWA